MLSAIKIIGFASVIIAIVVMYQQNKYMRLKIDTLQANNKALTKELEQNNEICDLYKGAITDFIKDENVTTEHNNTVFFNLDRL